MRTLIYGLATITLIVIMVTIKVSTLALCLMAVGLYLTLDELLPDTREMKRQLGRK